MDYKQKHIFYKICKDNNLPIKNTFVQYRNLKEFKNFYIERINPTHIIYLFGRLKKNQIHDNHYNKIIKVGEIIISMGFVMLTDSIIFNIVINVVTGSIIFNILMEYILENNKNVDRNRGRNWFWKNRLHGSVCID